MTYRQKWLYLEILVAILILTIGMNANGEIYKWTDDEGTTHFSDKPVNKKGAKKITVNTAPENNAETGKKSTNNKKLDPAKIAEERNKTREELTEELRKAREEREAKRQKQKEEAEKRQVKCQEEKTNLALMENELLHLEEKLKKMQRLEREKSAENIKKADLQIRLKRQKQKMLNVCN